MVKYGITRVKSMKMVLHADLVLQLLVLKNMKASFIMMLLKVLVSHILFNLQR